jgi:hypothetical protein
MHRAKDILPKITNIKAVKPPTPIQERLLGKPDEDLNSIILFQHSVLCQTCIPYEDPKELRIWERRNGNIQLEVLAGRVLDPNTQQKVEVGLPFGPKPRLVLYHLNAEAMRTKSSTVNLEHSLTAFVNRTLKLSTDGRTIRAVKDQLNRLAAADFRFYASYEGHAQTVKGTVIKSLDLWISKDERQRVLWPSVVEFSHDYFESLMEHAVPLQEEAVSRLSHTAIGLDVYTWLAQRLHRVSVSRPAFIPWDRTERTVRPRVWPHKGLQAILPAHTRAGQGGVPGCEVHGGREEGDNA